MGTKQKTATANRGGKRPSPPRGEARRQLILEAALRVIAREGPAAVTHRRVGEEAGLPLAATTYWFDSKDELLYEAYRLAAERDGERLRRLAAEQGGDVVAIVLRLLTEDEGEDTAAASYTIAAEATRRPRLRAISRAWTATYVEVLAEALTAAGSPRPELDANLLTLTVIGIMNDRMATGVSGGQEREVVERLISSLLGGRG